MENMDKPKYRVVLVKESSSGEVTKYTLGRTFDSKYNAKKGAKRALLDSDFETFEIEQI